MKKKGKSLNEIPDTDSEYSRLMNKKKSSEDTFQDDGESLQKKLGIEDLGYERGGSQMGSSHWTLKQILKNVLDEIRRAKKK